jgi:hypothetical protein
MRSVMGSLSTVNLAYVPFSIAAGVIGSRLGHRVFDQAWSSVTDAPKPKPGAPDQSLVKVAVVAAVEAGTIAASAAIAHELGARTFHYLFGAWPKKLPKPETTDS